MYSRIEYQSCSPFCWTGVNCNLNAKPGHEENIQTLIFFLSKRGGWVNWSLRMACPVTLHDEDIIDRPITVVRCLGTDVHTPMELVPLWQFSSPLHAHCSVTVGMCQLQWCNQSVVPFSVVLLSVEVGGPPMPDDSCVRIVRSPRSYDLCGKDEWIYMVLANARNSIQKGVKLSVSIVINNNNSKQ